MFHNPELYKYLKAATKEASDLLYSIKSGQMVPPKDIDAAIANEASFISCVGYLTESYDIEWIKLLPSGTRVEKIRKLILHHIKNCLGIPFFEIKGTCTFMEEEEITSYSFPDYFSRFSEQTFDKYYSEYEEYLSSASNKHIKYRIVAALENFDCDLPLSTITLSNNVRILPSYSTCYSDTIIKNQDLWRNIFDLETGNYEPPGFFLEIDYDIEKKIVPLECKEHIEHISLEKIKNVFKILRLYKEGSFACGLIYWCSKTPCDPPYSDDYILEFYGNWSKPNAYLLQKDVEMLQHLFRKYLNNLEKDGFPHNAIYYLDKGIREYDMADRLVNYTAALEFLFVDVEDKEGIASQLANKTAFFLEEDGQRCSEIFKDIKKAYGFRSRIVHGDYHKIKYDHLERYCNIIEGYTRRSIIKWIDMIDKGKKAKEILDSIERVPLT
jgi:hypothetical protein